MAVIQLFGYFLSAIRREQALNEIHIEKLLIGIECNRIKKKYRNFVERLKSFASKFYGHQNVVEYLVLLHIILVYKFLSIFM